MTFSDQTLTLLVLIALGSAVLAVVFSIFAPGDGRRTEARGPIQTRRRAPRIAWRGRRSRSSGSRRRCGR